jgi:hypothetical protein
MLDATERSSVLLSAVLILDQQSSLRSFIDWQACCGDFGVPARSKLACLKFRANFCPHAGRTAPAVNRRRSKLRLNPMVTR